MKGAAPRREKLWQLYLSLANGHSPPSSLIPRRVALIHSSGGFCIPPSEYMIRAWVNSQYPQRFTSLETWNHGNTCDVQPWKETFSFRYSEGTCLMMWIIIIQTETDKKGKICSLTLRKKKKDQLHVFLSFCQRQFSLLSVLSNDENKWKRKEVLIWGIKN